MQFLMTHSLLSAWVYALKENPFEDATSESDKYSEFLKTLNRERTETTDAMRKGIEFEDLVTDIALGGGDEKSPWFDAASKIAKVVKGGAMQLRAYKEIAVGNVSILLHGRLDTLKTGRIYDIKFSGSYDKGKYFSSTQHPTYFALVPEAFEFTYLVSNGSAVWTETYRPEDTPSIIPTIEEFLSWLDARGLMDTYKAKWAAR